MNKSVREQRDFFPRQSRKLIGRQVRTKVDAGLRVVAWQDRRRHDFEVAGDDEERVRSARREGLVYLSARILFI